MLDRPRHDELAHRVTSTGTMIKFITDGDVVAAVMAATPGSGVDLLLGIGGTPEGAITACAIQCLGGVDELVSGDDAFFVMTGITDGELLHGVRHGRDRAITGSRCPDTATPGRIGPTHPDRDHPQR